MGSQGFEGAVGIDSSNPVTKGFDVSACGLRRQQQILDLTGLRGTRSHRSERTRKGNYTVSGPISFDPSPEDLALLLPWIMGANASGTTFALADTLQERYVTVDTKGKVMTYDGCQVGRAVFSCAEGQSMKLNLDVTGKTETIGAAASFPSVAYTNTAPFMFGDAALTLVGTSGRKIRNFEISIDNALEVRFYNSVTAQSIMTRDRIITLRCSNPWTSSEVDLYDQATAGSAATLALTFDNYSISFAFAKLQFPSIGPVLPGRSEIPLELNGVARMSNTTKELIITLDSTP